MACALQPAEESHGETPRCMTRCECAGVSFEEIARRLVEQRLSLDEACGRTGCGQTCTACIPDLRAYLASL